MDHYAPHVDYRRHRLQHEAEVRRLVDPQDGPPTASTGTAGSTLRRTVVALTGLIVLTTLTAGAVALGAIDFAAGNVTAGGSAWYLR